MSKYVEIDLSRVKTYSITERRSKVHIQDFGKVFASGGTFEDFFSSLPTILAGRDFRELVERIITAHRIGRPTIVMMGAHLIKVGLSPILIDLMERGIVAAVAMNGAGIVHDCELALWGITSENVAENIKDGSFGMAKETADFINGAIKKGMVSKTGLGEILGVELLDAEAPNKPLSLLARGYELGVPVTVHVGMGTDIIHQHPSADGAAIGELSLRDFRIFTSQVSQLGEGGVILNVGSAVLLPEVFVKALNLARNLGHRVVNFTAANFDMYRHYRPQVNVLGRPLRGGGKGFDFSGHHEIMIPLLAAAVKLGLT